MRIIFLKDVPRVGKKHEIKDVADGYGKHLVAQKVAELATKEAITSLEKRMAASATMKKVHSELLMKNLEALAGTSITLRGKTNDKGHLCASIHFDEILAELKRATHIDMNPDYVVLERPLKEVGTYKIPVVIEKNRVEFEVVVEGVS